VVYLAHTSRPSPNDISVCLAILQAHRYAQLTDRQTDRETHKPRDATSVEIGRICVRCTRCGLLLHMAHVPLPVCVSVCLLGTAVSPTRMAERSRDCPMSCACRPNGRSVCRVLEVVLLQTLREAIGTSLFSRIHHIVRQRHTSRLHFCSRRLENVVPVPRKSKKSNSFVLGIAAKANY